MQFYQFPDVTSSDETGMVAISEEITPEMTISAYVQGIFPWPIDPNSYVTWFSPDPRAIIEFNELHIPKRLAKTIRQDKFQLKYNCAFNEVIQNCKKIPRAGEPGTWITNEIESCYKELHNQKYAYSFEAYYEGDLVGGVYGVRIGNFVSGESMFHKKTDASKVALVMLIEYFQQIGITWMDIQMLTPVTTTLGGKEIPREEFIKKLASSLSFPK